MNKFAAALCVPGLLVLSLAGCSSDDNSSKTAPVKPSTSKSTTLSSAQITANNEKIYGKKVDSSEFDALMSSMNQSDKNPRVTKVEGNVDKSDGFTDETMDGGTYQVWAGCAKGTIKITHNRKIIAKDIACNGKVKNVVDKICVAKGSNNFMVETSTKSAFSLGTIKTKGTCDNNSSQ